MGVNKYETEEKPLENIFTVDDSIRKLQVEKIKKLKAERDNEKVNQLLIKLENAAKSNENLVPVILEACESYATLGEISNTLL